MEEPGAPCLRAGLPAARSTTLRTKPSRQGLRSVPDVPSSPQGEASHPLDREVFPVANPLSGVCWLLIGCSQGCPCPSQMDTGSSSAQEGSLHSLSPCPRAGERGAPWTQGSMVGTSSRHRNTPNIQSRGLKACSTLHLLSCKLPGWCIFKSAVKELQCAYKYRQKECFCLYS